MKKYIYYILLLFVPIILESQNLDKEDLSISKCGLNYFAKFAKISSRTLTAEIPLPINTQPIKFSINEIKSDKCYKIEKAVLIWSVSYKANSSIVPEVIVQSPSKQYKTAADLIGEDKPKAWGEIGTRGFMADVTSAITTNGDYLFSVSTNNWETDGLCLFVIYSDYNANFRGHLNINYGLYTTPVPYYRNLTKMDICQNSINGKAFMLVSDLQPFKLGKGNWESDVIVKLNSQNLLTQREFFSFYEINTNYTQGQTASSFGLNPDYVNYKGTSDFYSLLMIGSYYQSTECKICPEPAITSLSSSLPNDSACVGSTVTITANSNADSVYWTDNSNQYVSSNNTMQIILDKSKKYFLNSLFGNGCRIIKDSISIIAITPPELDYPDSISICGGTPSQIKGKTTGIGSPFTYLWTPATGLSDDKISEPFVNLNTETTYTLTVTDRFGCVNSTKINVKMSVGANVKTIPDTLVCINSLLTLNTVINGGEQPLTIEWSPATKFSNPNLQNPTILIDTSITFIVAVTDAKGCVSTDSIAVTVADSLIYSLPDSLQVCFGDSVNINAEIIKGMKPFSFVWNNKNNELSKFQNLTYLPIESEFVYFSISDSIGCTKFDSVFISVNPLPKPKLNYDGIIELCPCDSLILNVSEEFKNYQWSTNDTTKSIVVKNDGVYQVEVIDSNGCKNVSNSVEIRRLNPYTRISFDRSIYSYSNAEQFAIIMRIDSSENLNDCKFENFSCKIRMNKSLLVPQKNTLFGDIFNSERVISIEKSYQNNENLDTLYFITTLGDAEETDIKIEDFKWLNCDYRTESVNSKYIPNDICRADSIARLFLSPAKPKLLIYPNPIQDVAEIEFNLNKSSDISIYITDMLGGKIFEKHIHKDEFSKNVKMTLDFSNLKSAVYFIRINSDFEQFTEKLIITR